MKHLLLTTIAAVVLVGCATTEPPEPPTAKALDIPLWQAARIGHIEAVKKHLTDSVDVNAKDEDGETPLDWVVMQNHNETVDLLRKHGGQIGAVLKAEATNEG